jgi:hypothetical protein
MTKHEFIEQYCLERARAISHLYIGQSTLVEEAVRLYDQMDRACKKSKKESKHAKRGLFQKSRKL